MPVGAVQAGAFTSTRFGVPLVVFAIGAQRALPINFVDQLLDRFGSGRVAPSGDRAERGLGQAQRFADGFEGVGEHQVRLAWLDSGVCHDPGRYRKIGTAGPSCAVPEWWTLPSLPLGGGRTAKLLEQR
jgi:hypothetical protein